MQTFFCKTDPNQHQLLSIVTSFQSPVWPTSQLTVLLLVSLITRQRQSKQAINEKMVAIKRKGKLRADRVCYDL